MNVHDSSRRNIESALISSRMIEECLVLSRESKNSGEQWIAYVVPSGTFSPDRLRAHLNSVFPDMKHPVHFVPMFGLPRSASGQIDEPALLKYEVIDNGVIQRCEENLRAIPGVQHAAAIVEENVARISRLHLSDLLIDSDSSLSISGTAPQTDTQRNAEPLTEIDSGATRMSLADGGPLEIPADAPKTLCEALIRTARRFPRKGIVYIQPDGGADIQTYSSLLEDSKRVLSGLYARGLKPHDRVILQFDGLRDHFTTFWACVLGGITPVNVALAPSYREANGVVNKLFNTWKLLGQPCILTHQRLLQSLAELPKIVEMQGLRLLPIEELQQSAPNTQIYEATPHDLVFFQLTSGSTGVPKCIQETHRGIIAHIHGAQQYNGYMPDDIDLNWLPLDHVVPILTCHLKDVYLGCQQVQIKTDQVLADPLKWLDCIEKYRATHSWSPNFGFKLVSDALAKSPGKTWNLSTMKFFMNAGEQVTRPVIKDFLDRLLPFGVKPNAMQPAFGMAEVCTCMTYQSQFDFESGVHRITKSSLGGRLKMAEPGDLDCISFVDLGPVVPGVQIRITDSNNCVVPEGTIGRLQIKGDVVTPGYYKNDPANKEAFVGDGWFNSGDLGFMWNGNLTLTGREKEMIIIRGANFYCYEIEDVVNRLEGVEPTFVAACAVADPSSGTEGLAIFFVPKPELQHPSATVEKIQLIRSIKATVTADLGITPAFVIPLTKATFPKTTSGKIQRSQLKKALEAGHFAAVIKELDIELESPNTLPDWFFRKIWIRKERSHYLSWSRECTRLLFIQRESLGSRVFDELRMLEHPCIAVEPGTEFHKQAQNRYTIDPGQSAHYALLLESIEQDNLQIDEIQHFWTCDNSEIADLHALLKAQHYGLNSILHLVRALARTNKTQHPTRLQVVSTGLQPVSTVDRIAPQHGALLGLLKTIPHEIPWLQCSHIDLPRRDTEINVDHVLNEISLLRGDPEVAYREGQRLVSRLEPADMRKGKKQPIPLKNNGIYLITGGLGGIGAQIARFLLQRYSAKLLLLGRTPLNLSNPDEKARQRLEALNALRMLPGEVAYEAVDICDASALAQSIQRMRTRFKGDLDGIIHLAGHFEERLLSDETVESMSATLQPKMAGVWNLAALLKESRDAVFISFSSVNSYFGGATVGAYAAGNSFVDTFMKSLAATPGMRAHCYAWAPWDEIGMSHGYKMKALSRSRGYYNIAAAQGVASLLAALHHGDSDLIIGLDAANPNIRHQMGDAKHTQALCAYFASKDFHAPKAHLETFVVHDQFGTPVSVQLRPVNSMPLTEEGEVDRAKLLAGRRSSKQRVLPRNELERKLAEIWEEALGQPQLGIDDSFFELGGHSLLATQILYKLQQLFKVDLPLRCLFETPTVRGLAAEIEKRRQGIGEFQAMPVIQPALAQRHDPFPLTDIQQAYWVGRTNAYEIGNVGCHVYTEVQFTQLDLHRLTTALRRLIERHEMLRAVMTPDGQQKILKSAPDFEIKTLDLRNKTESEASTELENVRQILSHQVLPADKAPMFELRASLLREGVRLHCSFDLLIADARSFQILLHELSDLYEDPSRELPPLQLSFRDYVLNENELKSTDLFRRSREYWLKRLPSLPPGPELPLAKNPASIRNPRFVRRSIHLSPQQWQRLKDYAAGKGLTPSGVLLAAYADTLALWSKSPRFTINLTLFNRLPLHPQSNQIVGDFTSCTLLSAERASSGCFLDRAHQLKEQLWKDLDHRYFSGVQVLREMARATNGSAANPVTMPVVFTSVLDLPDSNTGKPKLLKDGTIIYGITQTPQVWLDNQVFPDDEGVVCNWDAVEELFPDGMLDDMFASYARRLEELADNESSWRQQWPRFVEAALPRVQQNQRAAINATSAPIPNGLLQGPFAAQVRLRGDDKAAICGNKALTYRELDEQSNQVAWVLRRMGAKPNMLVAVILEKSCEQIVAILGVLKSGAAYLPIDPEIPRERLLYLLANGEVSIVLTSRALNDRIEWPTNIARLTIDGEELLREEKRELQDVQQASDLAYVIYTSGSTGKPKGVMIDHRGALNTIADINLRFKVGPRDRVLALSSLTFDLSVYDIFGILAAGGTIVLPESGKLRDPAHWAELIARHEITLWNSVPALMQLLADHAVNRRDAIASLRLIMMSGDWIPVALPERIKVLVPAVQTISLGGATEASIWSILYPIESVQPEWKSIPYGKPMKNQSFHVLNESMEPCPVWVPGMLYIGGVGLAHGYWRDEERTRASFVVHPRTGMKLYRTGDLGRYLPDGNIEFMGREDFQVKVNGFRIELGEIEAALEKHPGIRACCVAAVGDRGNRRLIGYLVPVAEAPDTQAMREFLTARLPEYMVPGSFVTLDTLPLSSNGKVDRRALPEPDSQKNSPKTEFVAPRSPLEVVIAGLIAEILNVEQVGVFDNFFERGGHSLLAIQFISRLRDTLEIEPSVNSLFKAPTVAGVAELLLNENDAATRTRIEKTAEVLLTVSNLSGEEIDIDRMSLI